MDAVVYTTDGQEYEMLSGILEEESRMMWKCLNIDGFRDSHFAPI